MATDQMELLSGPDYDPAGDGHRRRSRIGHSRRSAGEIERGLADPGFETPVPCPERGLRSFGRPRKRESCDYAAIRSNSSPRTLPCRKSVLRIYGRAPQSPAHDPDQMRRTQVPQHDPRRHEEVLRGIPAQMPIRWRYLGDGLFAFDLTTSKTQMGRPDIVRLLAKLRRSRRMRTRNRSASRGFIEQRALGMWQTACT